MQLINTVKIDKPETVINLKTTKGPAFTAFKIFLLGSLRAQSGDRHMLLRVNGSASNYTSFVIMDGHSHTGEWDNSGFYLGRNGWSLDANFSAEYTLTSMFQNKILGSGMSTFSMGNNTILGYTANGFMVIGDSIRSITVAFTGGVPDATLKLYAY